MAIIIRTRGTPRRRHGMSPVTLHNNSRSILAVVRTTPGSRTIPQRNTAPSTVLPTTCLIPRPTAYATDNRLSTKPRHASNDPLRSHPPLIPYRSRRHALQTSRCAVCRAQPRETNIRGLRLEHSAVHTCSHLLDSEEGRINRPQRHSVREDRSLPLPQRQRGRHASTSRI